ncbi:MAG TPA: hypothetical protein VG407_15895 [Caulobacteraceae bacterium]|jgi:hypothetical protein|nr:hypothetical protein [Caulobacteraceae bacterium]
MAERASEVAALAARIQQAEVSAAGLGLTEILGQFVAATGRSQAVMNRSLGALSGWLSSSNPLFLSFFRQREQGRPPDGSEWDEQRLAAEAAINPYCYTELNYAALTLDGSGMPYYGPYSVVLKEITIEDRASIFEENPFIFNKNHHVIAGSTPPLGYRTSWARRGELCGAKLHGKLTAQMKAPDFAPILMERKGSESDCDFVEVHIYGPVNRVGIASVRGVAPKRAGDRIIWKQAVGALKKLGATVEEVS